MPPAGHGSAKAGHCYYATVSTLTGKGLFLRKDFHKYLDQDVIVRKLRDLTQEFRQAHYYDYGSRDDDPHYHPSPVSSGAACRANHRGPSP